MAAGVASFTSGEAGTTSGAFSAMPLCLEALLAITSFLPAPRPHTAPPRSLWHIPGDGGQAGRGERIG